MWYGSEIKLIEDCKELEGIESDEAKGCEMVMEMEFYR